MDVRCARCGEPWEAFYLRHDMAWWRCLTCDKRLERSGNGGWALHRHETTAAWCDHQKVRLEVEPAHDGQVPEQVRRWYERGEPGWLRLVATGQGCPDCYGRPASNPEGLSLSELDEIDTATEGMLPDWL